MGDGIWVGVDLELHLGPGVSVSFYRAMAVKSRVRDMTRD